MKGGRGCKGFLASQIQFGNICRSWATVDRKDSKIKHLMRNGVVTGDDVREAEKRIAGLVERTPLIESEIQGIRVWLKCECLQTGGAFKVRGATNRLLQLSPEERERG